MVKLFFRLASRVLLPLASVAFVARPVLGQDSQAENVAAARALGIQGVQLADAGKCDQAIEKLSRAESLYHAPTILGRLGECQVNVGQIVLGSENLNRVVREPLAANAPKAFRDAQERAKKVLEIALPRIAYLTVNVEPRDAKPEVTVGSSKVPAALLGVERPTDPGTHEVVASAPGFLSAKSQVTLKEAGHETVTLTMNPDPNAPKPDAVPATPPPPPGPTPTPPPAAEKSGSNVPAYVLLGVGGVGIVVGSITGIMALGAKGDLDCPQNKCAGSEGEELDSAKTKALISTIGFAVGGAAAAVGTVLLIAGSSKKENGKSVPGLTARAYVGLGTAGISGSW